MYSSLGPRRPFVFSLEKRGFTLRGFQLRGRERLKLQKEKKNPNQVVHGEQEE